MKLNSIVTIIAANKNAPCDYIGQPISVGKVHDRTKQIHVRAGGRVLEQKQHWLLSEMSWVLRCS